MNKLTIVKVLAKGTPVSEEDLERWRQVFVQNLMTVQEAEATKHTLTLVKIGNEDYKPSVEDLQAWRDIFEEASQDPDFKIFTHEHVNVEVIDLGQVIAIE